MWEPQQRSFVRVCSAAFKALRLLFFPLTHTDQMASDQLMSKNQIHAQKNCKMLQDYNIFSLLLHAVSYVLLSTSHISSCLLHHDPLMSFTSCLCPWLGPHLLSTPAAHPLSAYSLSRLPPPSQHPSPSCSSILVIVSYPDLCLTRTSSPVHVSSPAPRASAAVPVCMGRCRWRACPSGWGAAWTWRPLACQRWRRHWGGPWRCSRRPGSSGPASGSASAAPGSGSSSTPGGAERTNKHKNTSYVLNSTEQSKYIMTHLGEICIQWSPTSKIKRISREIKSAISLKSKGYYNGFWGILFHNFSFMHGTLNY